MSRRTPEQSRAAGSNPRPEKVAISSFDAPSAHIPPVHDTESPTDPTADVALLPFGDIDEQVAEAFRIAEHAGKEIATNFRALPPRQRRSIVNAFRRQLFPPGKPGRRRSKEITAAYTDWKAGMRGLALYRKHIPRFDRMGHWERKVKTRALMDALRARKRREQKAANTGRRPSIFTASQISKNKESSARSPSLSVP